MEYSAWVSLKICEEMSCLPEVDALRVLFFPSFDLIVGWTAGITQK